MPMTAAFTLAAAVLLSLLYGRSWQRAGAVLLTCTVLVLLLGLNVSVIGLVAIPRGSLYLVVELFGLILAINAVYVVVFIGLERKSLTRGAPSRTRQVAGLLIRLPKEISSGGGKDDHHDDTYD